MTLISPPPLRLKQHFFLFLRKPRHFSERNLVLTHSQPITKNTTMAPSAHLAPNPTPLYIALALVSAFCIVSFFFGAVCVRLWYYKGALGPEPERFIVLPEYLRRRHRRRGRRASVQTTNTHDTEFPGARGPSTPPLAGPSREQQAGSGALHINVEYADSEGYEDAVRRHIAEERRLSCLPIFVRDDCGDGSDFPDVPIALHPIEDPVDAPIHASESAVYAHRGIKEVPVEDWLDINPRQYMDIHDARKSLLAEQRADCIQTMPAAKSACEELLQSVAIFLERKYPKHFKIEATDDGNGKLVIRNQLPQEVFALEGPWRMDPLEICAQLAVEDFHVFKKGEEDGQWRL